MRASFGEFFLSSNLTDMVKKSISEFSGKNIFCPYVSYVSYVTSVSSVGFIFIFVRSVNSLAKPKAYPRWFLLPTV